MVLAWHRQATVGGLPSAVTRPRAVKRAGLVAAMLGVALVSALAHDAIILGRDVAGTAVLRQRAQRRGEPPS